MKLCFKCNIEKEYGDFYRHTQMADGYLGKCKECTKKDVRVHRRDNESVREYDRRRAKFPHRKVNSAKWRRENPAKYSAQTAVGNAVRDGRLKKMPCDICGDLKVHAHHDDYSKPLDVRWLCPLHHARYHAGSI